MHRAAYVALALATIAAGLLVHLAGSPLAPGVRDMLGDALWAMMIAWWAGALVPRDTPLVTRGVAAFVFCVLIECSQLVHTPGLDALRATRLGHLVLGSGFDPRDLAAYAFGVAIAVLAERAWRRRST